MESPSIEASCANCGQVTRQPYCGNCGQRAVVGRLTVSSVVKQAFRAFLEFDSEIWRTVTELTLNPGKVADNYVSGQRVRYINPVKYLFVSFAVSYGLMHLTGTFDTMMIMMEEAQLVETEAATKVSSEEGALIQAMSDLYRHNMDLLTFITTPLFALLFRLQNLRAGRNFAEVLSFCCFIFGHTYLLSITFTMIHLATGYLFNWPQMVIMLGYFFYGSKVFFDRGWLRSVSTIIFASFYYFLTLVVALLVLSNLKVLGVF